MSDTRLVVGWMNDAQREAHERLQRQLVIREHKFFAGRSDEEEEKLPIDVSIMCLYDIGWNKKDIAVHLDCSLAYVKAITARELWLRNNMGRKR